MFTFERLSAYIEGIHLMGRKPEVGGPIIHRIEIAMINPIFRRQSSMKKLIDDSGRNVRLRASSKVNHYDQFIPDVPVWPRRLSKNGPRFSSSVPSIEAPANPVRLEMMSGAVFPSQYSSIWIVVKTLLQVGLWWNIIELGAFLGHTFGRLFAHCSWWVRNSEGRRCANSTAFAII